MTIFSFNKKVLVGAAVFLFVPSLVVADTLYLKNGSHVEGIIEREDKDGVELNLGFGTTTFHRSEIDRVVRSDTKEKEAIWQEWGAKEKEIEKRKPEEERKWRERQLELDRVHREEEQAKKEKDEFGAKDIQVITKDQSMLVNVLLNGNIRATLVLDSGAATVMLSRRVAEKLGIDVDQLKKVNTQVADGRMVQAGSTTLERVKVQNAGFADAANDDPSGIESKNVDVSFLLGESNEKESKIDGLLGMSFLKHYKFNADYKNSQVTFERLKEENISNP